MSLPDRATLFARTRFAERADAALRLAWRRGLSPEPLIEPDWIWRRAAKGYTPADEREARRPADIADFRERLDRLCTAIAAEARLNALGRTMAYGQIAAAVERRHALGRLWRMRPALAMTPIAAPIVVLGQMRSGTTRVQRLLAADPAHAGTRFCDSQDPLPARPDFRPLKARALLAMLRRFNPWLDTLHPVSPTRTDEEIGWLAAALSPPVYEAQWIIPSYARWSESRSSAPIYGEFARILRTDAAARGNAGRPRVLKCPQYSQDLPALLERFPDARLVVCTRDDAAVLASSVSMVAAQMAYQTDHHDRAAVEGEWRRKMAWRAARLDEALARHRGPVARLSFDELNADWEGAVAGAYRTLGLTFSAEARAAMANEQARAARDGHRAHRKQIRRLNSA